MKLALALALLLLCPAAAPAQQRLTFEVASIRLAPADATNGYIKATPGGNGYTVRNIPVKLIFSLMYKVPMRQIQGGPPWFDTLRFDIEARADRQYSIDDLHTMMQNLLADRFALKFHTAVHEGNIYALTVNSSGLKMKLNSSPQDFNIPVNPGPEGLVGRRVDMVYLTWLLGQQLQDDERPVVDQTGLKGNYDFTLNFTPPRQPAADDGQKDRPSLFIAVREQLGLKLTPQRGPVTEYLIDTLEKPSEN